MSNITESKPTQGLVASIAGKYGVDPEKLLPTLKKTAFRQSGNNEVSNEQMMALLIVANEYGLNPFTKEIFAFPDKGGIVPVVSVDGWSRIINENPQMDGIEFEYSPETVEFKGKTCHVWIDCIIYRKDRSRPIRVREFFAEVARNLSYASPWDTHPNRMHRHKAEIQCARIAFGFAGIYDMDEAERIIEASSQRTTSPELNQYSDEQKQYFDQLLSKSDSLGLFIFRNSVGEAIFSNLYHSFEKGQKGKYQRIVDNLYEQGRSKAQDFLAALQDSAQRNDDFGINELLDGLDQETIQWLLDESNQETASVMREVIKQMQESA